MPLKFTIIDIHESFYATKSSCFTGCTNIFALIRPRGLGQEKNICALDGWKFGGLLGQLPPFPPPKKKTNLVY